MSKYTMLEGYSKAQAVIKSCKNSVHLKGAEKYADLFLNANNEPEQFNFVWEYYLQLQNSIKAQEERILLV